MSDAPPIPNTEPRYLGLTADGWGRILAPLLLG